MNRDFDVVTDKAEGKVPVYDENGKFLYYQLTLDGLQEAE